MKVSAVLVIAQLSFLVSVPMPVVAPNTGMSIRKGTAVTSWKTEMARLSCPCGVASSFCFVSCWLMIVEEDCAKTVLMTKVTVGFSLVS